MYFSGSDFTGLITTAGNATIIIEGGTVTGASGGTVSDSATRSTAGQALIVANGGENGGAPRAFTSF